MSDRKAGWYWVVPHENQRWIPAFWNPGYGKWNDIARIYADDDLHKIGPSIPSPDEPWKTVPVEPTPEMVEAACTESNEVERDYERAGARWDWRMMLEAAPNP